MQLRGRPAARGALGGQVDSSWWTHSAISRSSQCPTTSIQKGRWYVLFYFWDIRGPLLGKYSPCIDGSVFPLPLTGRSCTICQDRTLITILEGWGGGGSTFYKHIEYFLQQQQQIIKICISEAI